MHCAHHGYQRGCQRPKWSRHPYEVLGCYGLGCCLRSLPFKDCTPSVCSGILTPCLQHVAQIAEPGSFTEKKRPQRTQKTFPRKGNTSWKLLEAFATYPDRAMSDQESYELAQEIHPEFTSRNYWQRISHLIELGFVEKVGKRVTPSGGWGRVCRVTEAGRRLLSF